MLRRSIETSRKGYSFMKTQERQGSGLGLEESKYFSCLGGFIIGYNFNSINSFKREEIFYYELR